LEQLKIGTKYKIRCYKHDSTFHREWDEAVILDETDDYIVCGNYKTKVVESNGHSYRTKEPAILYFYKHNWYNVIAQLKPFGLFYYCNIASPYVIDNDTIKYIDYDLDLRVFPDRSYKVLDRNEYKYHRRIMHYPKEICLIIENELNDLIVKKKNGVEGFNRYEIEKYVRKYRKLSQKNVEKLVDR